MLFGGLSDARVDPEEPLVEGDLLSLDVLEELSGVELHSKVGVALAVQDLDGQHEQAEVLFLWVVLGPILLWYDAWLR